MYCWYKDKFEFPEMGLQDLQDKNNIITEANLLKLLVQDLKKKTKANIKNNLYKSPQ